MTVAWQPRQRIQQGPKHHDICSMAGLAYGHKTIANNMFGYHFKYKQECIPVGCILSTAVTVSLGGCLLLGGVCSRGVCCSGGVSAPVGVCSRGCLLLGGHLLLGGVCSWGGLLWGGVCSLGGCGIPSMHWGRHPHLLPCGQTDACKNITFATSLRTVNIIFWKNIENDVPLKNDILLWTKMHQHVV